MATNQLTARDKAAKDKSQAIANMAASKHEDIRSMLGSSELARKFTTDLKLLALNPSLTNCEPKGLFTAALSAGQLGLSIVPQKGEAYMVPYGKDANLQIGYKGWLALAKSAGLEVNTFIVYEGDDFDAEYVAGEMKIKFKPDLFSRDDANPDWVEENIKGAIVAVKNINDGSITEKFVTGATLKKIKAQNPAVAAGKNSPWKTWPAEMYSGKACKYILSKMPMGDNFAKAVSIENDYENQAKKNPVTGLPAPGGQANQTSGNEIDDFISLGGNTVDTSTGEVMEATQVGNGQTVNPQQQQLV